MFICAAESCCLFAAAECVLNVFFYTINFLFLPLKAMADRKGEECRSVQTSSPVRCAVLVQGGAVLTGHEDGMVRAWRCDGSSSWKETDNARWKVQIKMHNTAVCCLIPSRTGSVWTASSAGSIRQIGLDGARTRVEAKAPASKSAHSTAINAAVVTSADTLWTGARNVRVWTATGEWRQSLQTHAGKVLSMAVAAACVWVGFSDGRLRLFEEETGVCVVQLQDDGKHPPITCLVPTAQHMWTGTADGHVSCFALQSHRQLLEAPVFVKSGVFALAPTLRSVWVGGERGVVVPLPRPRESEGGGGEGAAMHALLREDSAEIDSWLARPMPERVLSVVAAAAAAANSRELAKEKSASDVSSHSSSRESRGSSDASKSEFVSKSEFASGSCSKTPAAPLKPHAGYPQLTCALLVQKCKC